MQTKQQAEQSKKARRLLKLPQVCNKTGFSKTFTYSQIAEGNFPAQIRVGRSSFWVESEIDAYIDQLVAERDAA